MAWGFRYHGRVGVALAGQVSVAVHGAWNSSSSNSRIYWCDDIIQQLIVKKEKGEREVDFYDTDIKF